MIHRVLFVAYQFPPVGGAGIQRSVKFCKYLPRNGWIPSVLTVANPSVPLLDASLAREVPPGVPICRARTLEPGYDVKRAVSAADAMASSGAMGFLKGLARRLATLALQPDPQILWAPDAIRRGTRLLRKMRHEAVLVTAPPFSAFLVGAVLARKFKLPLILDYRDEWTISSDYWENKRPDVISRRIQQVMERHLLRRAACVIATSVSSAAALRERCVAARAAANVRWIYNGYDPDDFAAPPSPVSCDPGMYRLTYVGTLWNLASVTPLVRAVGELARTRPDLAAHLELVIAGRRTAQQQQQVDQLKTLPCRLIEHPYLDHRQAVELMRRADGLVILVSDLPGAQRIMPGKVFETLAARRPILAIAPRGEVWDILAGHPAARRLLPGDSHGIAAALAEEIERHLACPNPAPIDWDSSRFDRRAQAAELAGVLNSLVGLPMPRPRVHRHGVNGSAAPKPLSATLREF